mmetsp:Transcript_30563/g.88873  ORF Transcript_30563/g.88873 Transcript_30563/m.88873 type:complete len:217 (+) Transcript_30563:493-1143(+)
MFKGATAGHMHDDVAVGLVGCKRVDACVDEGRLVQHQLRYARQQVVAPVGVPRFVCDRVLLEFVVGCVAAQGDENLVLVLLGARREPVEVLVGKVGPNLPGAVKLGLDGLLDLDEARVCSVLVVAGTADHPDLGPLWCVTLKINAEALGCRVHVDQANLGGHLVLLAVGLSLDTLGALFLGVGDECVRLVRIATSCRIPVRPAKDGPARTWCRLGR